MPHALNLVVHLAATASMAGLIWFVQLVHYPLFGHVGIERFRDYESAHQRRTSWVVGPLMAVEGLTALGAVASPGGELTRTLPLVGLVLLAIVHSSTVFLQVPRHKRLAEGYDRRVAASLVTTNWIRTAGWTLRTGVAAAMVVAVLR